MRNALRAFVCLAIALSLTTPALAAGAKDLESTPQAKVFRANEKAIATGDVEAYKKTMSSEALKMMDTQTKEMKKSPKEILEFIKIMAPKDTKLTDLKVDGKKATLSMTGKSDGQAMKGSAELVEEGGQWKMGRQEWGNAK